MTLTDHRLNSTKSMTRLDGQMQHYLSWIRQRLSRKSHQEQHAAYNAFSRQYSPSLLAGMDQLVQAEQVECEKAISSAILPKSIGVRRSHHTVTGLSCRSGAGSAGLRQPDRGPNRMNRHIGKSRLCDLASQEGPQEGPTGEHLVQVKVASEKTIS